jgi:hypothetical protein
MYDHPDPQLYRQRLPTNQENEFYIFTIMRRLLTIMMIVAFLFPGYSQQLSQVTFRNGSNLAYLSFVTDQGVLIRISDEGKILEWGTEVVSDYYNYYDPKLRPFMGRIEYYGPKDDSIFRGKVKSIGTCFFTYYDTLQVKTKIGKLRTIGSQYLDYFEEYEDKIVRGKLKTAGGFSLDYFRSYDNESYRGKLKLVGSVSITYYSAFDDKTNAGKLKTIGTMKYAWYSLGDTPSLRGALKTNNYRQTISGVTYILN